MNKEGEMSVDNLSLSMNSPMEVEETITLSCVDHHQKLVGGLWNFLQAKRGVDFEVQWGEESCIRAHRLVLDVFLSIEKLSESGDCLTNNDHDSLLEFLYKGRVTVRKDSLPKLLKLARETEFQILVDAVDSAAANKEEAVGIEQSASSLPVKAVCDDQPQSSGVDDDVKMQSNFESDDDSNLISISATKTVDQPTKMVARPAAAKVGRKVDAKSKKVDRKVDTNANKVDRKVDTNGKKVNRKVYSNSKKVDQKVNSNFKNVDLQATGKVNRVTRKVGRPSKKDNKPLQEPTETETDAENQVESKSRTRKARTPRKCVVRNKSCVEDVDDEEQDQLEKAASDDGESSNFDPGEYSKVDKPIKKKPRKNGTAKVGRPKKVDAVLRKPREKGPFSCGECEKVYPKRSQLTLHERSHSGIKPFMCDTCGRGFTTSSNLAVHTRTHTGEKRYGCDICDRRFAIPKTLRQHRRTHTRETPFICEICERPFAWARDLRRHRDTHSIVKKYRCDECPKSFSQRKCLVAHKRHHTGDTPFECQLCPKKFAWPQCLKEHQKTHTRVKAFMCDECGKTFSSRPNLATHARSHAGIKRFACDVEGCGKKFTTLSNRLKHKLVHSGDKPHACEICSKRFTSARSLQEHNRLHSGERPFKCLVCNQASFVANKYLQRHKKLGRCPGTPAATRAIEQPPPTPPSLQPLLTPGTDVISVSGMPNTWILIPQVIV